MLALIDLTILLYIIMVSFFIFGWLKFYFSKQTTAKLTNSPFVSIIVAMRNERGNLPRLLKALCSQTYANYEIILVDDHSEDSSFDFAKNYDCPKLKVFKLTTGQGKKAALKLGISHAKGQITGFTDADCMPSRTWIEHMVRCMVGRNVVLCLGNVVLKFDKLSSFSALESLEFASLLASSIGSLKAGLPLMSNGANIFVVKDLALKAQLKEQVASGDDIFLLQWAARNGFRIDYCLSDRALVKTFPQGKLKKFVNQRLRWASKTSYYTHWWAKFVAFVVFFTNFALFVAFFAYSKVFFLLLLSKMLVDSLLLAIYLTRYKMHKLLILVPIMEIFYIFYAVLTGFLSQILTYEWKGRSFK